ncbi:DUF4160 domain-containing protein [Campylobacter corcagiensis]|uniref:DUF4160 domain-containing protein n=1 Tax=Campylobacter corcagiensis TaxID=1448857 RepID=A0A7M1LET0_9BACT|nr:DUF4160 domain-containing protein [Campylobacter corcagiensis]QKF64759.1 DUF4160 domain-containing protein [Campylobacter corcagiensis]QOQ87077.1 DUF4160 domain-containing protein [Campylobacter corcagiensis]
MPTLLKTDGFKFFFYSNEHEPKHIHILKGDEFAKINLENLEVVFSSLKGNDLKFALKILQKKKDDFIRIWDEYFKG